MKLFKYILSIFLSATIFVGSIGMYIIEDTCAPCGEVEVIAQIVSASYKTHCDSKDNECCSLKEKDCCCNDNAKGHKHNQDKHFFQNTPDYFQTISDIDLKPLTNIILFVLSKPDIEVDAVQVLLNKFSICSLNHSVSDTLSLLCTYLI